MDRSKISVWRIKIVHWLFIGLLIIIVAFLFRWQILEYDRYRILANQRVKDSQLASLRGSILSADASPLAYSIPVYDVYAYIPEIEDAEELYRQTREEFVEKVSKAIKLNKKDLKSSLSSNIVYTVVAKQITVDEKEKLEGLYTDKYEDIRLAGLHYEAS